jgi:hypothetical protein
MVHIDLPEVLHLEFLYKRYRHSGNCNLAIKYYNFVAEATKQKYLREKALRHAKECKEQLIKEEDLIEEKNRI